MDRAVLHLAEVSDYTTRHDVSGTDVDVGRFLDGEPECMVDFQPGPAQRRTVTVAFNVFISSGVDRQRFLRRGAAIAALVDALERSGLRCEVIMHFRGMGRREVLDVETVLKPVAEPLDLERLAFAACDVSVCRRLVLAYGAALTERESCWHPKHGARPAPERKVGDVYLDGLVLGGPWGSDREAAAWVLDRLREQGVELQEASA